MNVKKIWFSQTVSYIRWNWIAFLTYFLTVNTSFSLYKYGINWFTITALVVCSSLIYFLFEISKIMRYMMVNSSNFFTQLMMSVSDIPLPSDFAISMYSQCYRYLYKKILPNVHWVQEKNKIGFYIEPIEVLSKEERIYIYMGLSFLVGLLYTIHGYDKVNNNYSFIPKMNGDKVYLDFKFYGNFKEVKSNFYWKFIPFIFGFKCQAFKSSFLVNIPKNGYGLMRETLQKISWKVLDTGEVEVVYMKENEVISQPMIFNDLSAFMARFEQELITIYVNE